MENLTDLKKRLRKGDKAEIARRLSCTLDNVCKVFRGRHQNKRVIQAAREIVEDREKRSRKPLAA